MNKEFELLDAKFYYEFNTVFVQYEGNYNENNSDQVIKHIKKLYPQIEGIIIDVKPPSEYKGFINSGIIEIK